MADERAQNQGAQAKYRRTARAVIKIDGAKVVVKNQDVGGDVIYVGNGGVVHWECESPIKWWAIVMKKDTPLVGNVGHGGSNYGKQGVTKIRTDAHGGGVKEYSYAIVASDGNTVYFEDPELEVGPIGTG